MRVNLARKRRALPRQLRVATLYLFLAYWIVTALGILLTIVFAATLRPFPPRQYRCSRVPAYVMSVPFHPLLNFLGVARVRMAVLASLDTNPRKAKRGTPPGVFLAPGDCGDRSFRLGIAPAPMADDT
jgi:hypothetical protein